VGSRVQTVVLPFFSSCTSPASSSSCRWCEIVEVIFPAPVMWQQTSPAVGPSTSPSSLTAAVLQQEFESNSTMWSLVGSAKALNAFTLISLVIEMNIPYISIEHEMTERIQHLYAVLGSNRFDNCRMFDCCRSIILPVDEITAMLHVLADPTRLAVFQCIRGCGGQSLYDTETGECDAGAANSVAVCTVRCHVPCAPSTLSHHLNTLRDAGLISTEKRGRQVYAHVVPSALEQLAEFFASTTTVCSGTRAEAHLAT
jgi:DNA-binding transcriptional ArsR family regulator